MLDLAWVELAALLAFLELAQLGQTFLDMPAFPELEQLGLLELAQLGLLVLETALAALEGQQLVASWVAERQLLPRVHRGAAFQTKSWRIEECTLARRR